MELTILILLLPFFSFLILGIGGKWMSHRTAGTIGTLILGAVAVLSYVTAIQYFSAPRLEDGTFATLMPYNFTWLPFTETLHFDLGILLDPISVMMLIVISTVSLMVHIYSFGYMKGEVGFQRYYAFLSLFTMSMLGLVVATNIFQMYLFWELVGVSSYLLIGFYYTKPAAIAASKKAFIVTRFADLGFLIGILIYGYYGGTFGFTPDTVSLISGGASMLPLALGLMFVGGAGKSAMFPLHIWLPDAMEGPTPVSALIHAATMVVAGVYLVARMFPLFITYAPNTLHMVAWVGAFTAFYAASVACVQSDIKRVLAFSTISQIGFMMVALGVCTSMNPHEGGLGYMASMFHLFTHAMFKVMFLAVVTCGAGFIPFGHFISSNGESYSIHLDPSVAITSVVIAIISIAIATWMYKNAKQPVADSLAKRFKGLHKAAYNRFYIDDIYQFITHKIIFRCISTPIAWFDRHVVDGFFDFLAWATNTTSDEIRGLQSGQVQQYAYVFLCGALALILLLIL